MSRKNLDELGKRRRRDRINEILRNSRAAMENFDLQFNEEIVLQDDLQEQQEQQDNQQRYRGIELESNESLGSDSDDLGEEEERSEQYAEGEEEKDEEDDEEDEDDREREDGRGFDQNEEDEDFGMRQHRNDNDQDFHDRRPLYYGAPLNVGESMLLILTILLHHNVNYLCLADIITVINLHCLQQNLKKNSLFKFQRYFSLNESEMIKHYYCATCLRPLASVNDMCPSCPNKKNSYFVELPFVNQLKEMYKRAEFYDYLQWRFRRPRNAPDMIFDIYDGSLYREWMDNGFLNNPNNISFSWYTDGIPVFKSSKISVWPIYLTINELPFEIRKKKENTLLVGLWFGDKKPNANYFIYKFRDAFQKMAEGVEIFVPSQNRVINIRGVVLMGTCDLPAKCQFLNFVQFNGDYGCPTCFCKGENIPIYPNGSIHVYPYEEDSRNRTSEICAQYGNIANSDNPVMGVKGPTAFSKIMPDFMKGIGIDKMHAIDGGVVKKILTLLFDVKYRNYPFSLYHFIDVINNRLIKIKPPKFVHRMPRSIQDLLHWKASELKLWFFYYSIPVLEGIMRDDFFQHYLLLVVSISLLNGDFTTPPMIEIARDMLHKFVREFQIMYDLQFCSINIHQLLHLPDCVKTLGPLWAFSCFEYENLNGQFLKLVHGTWHIDTQIAKSHDQFIKMIKSIEKLPDGLIKDFCLNRKRQVKVIERITRNCYSVGYYKNMPNLSDIIRRALQNSGLEQFTSMWQYLRLLKDGQLFIAELYPRQLQSESFIIKYRDNGFRKLGLINCFLKMIFRCECNQLICQCESHHFAIIRQIEVDDVFVARGTQHSFSTEHFLQKCYVTDNVIAIDIARLETVCIRMVIEEKLYIGIPVNRTERE